MPPCPQVSGDTAAVAATADATSTGSPLVELAHPSVNDLLTED